MRTVAWLSGILANSDPAPLPVDLAKPPVVLVHGIDGSSRDMARLARAFQAEGREVFTPSLIPNDGSATLEELSAQLQRYVEDKVKRRPFDLVGYSMGGIVCRHYLQRRNGIKHVRRFVTLCSPHHGTLTAQPRSGPGARQMRRGSSFLHDLNQDVTRLQAVGFTSIWTPTDLMILPARSSEVPTAKNLRAWGIGHVSFILEKHGIRTVLDVLK